MALSIEDSETEHLAQRLAEITGETIAMATQRAIEERLLRIGSQYHRAALLDDLAEIRRRRSELPVVDYRTQDEVVGYDERGLPR
ncbi:PSK operon transcription factor [Bradyrhizobium guangdongense]|uniref:type II toxin-antitoxin system VapB family antitoxin n=1 Tax=Bradyrhizobium guangdongense TaxID=1325090 RepID=UPI001126B755|nr:type II toxin-antitoxin system VapB family antitoxin [Bradyrhizobium guangdongense]TPQ27794.1 PSK operon transcription factor [Bradyrhizobium guangdongense]